jgi:hypothetical protein
MEIFYSEKSVVSKVSGSFLKIEMQEFHNLKNLQFVKNTKFSKEEEEKKRLLQIT